jgi:DNA-binding phage protein
MKTMAKRQKRISMQEFNAKYIDNPELSEDEQREVEEYDAYLTSSLQISKILLVTRKSLNLTQQQLAEKLGLDQSEVSRLEGPDCNPTLKTLSKVAVALGLEIQMTPRQVEGELGAGN